MPKLPAPPPKYRRGFLTQLDGRNALTATMREMWEQMTADLGGEDLSLSSKAKLLKEKQAAARAAAQALKPSGGMWG